MNRSIFLVVCLVVFLAAAASAQQPPPQRGRLPPNFPGRPNAAQPVKLLDPLAAPPRPTDAPSLDLSGSWKGVYCSDDSVIIADLTLTTDAREVKILTRRLDGSASAARCGRPATGTGRVVDHPASPSPLDSGCAEPARFHPSQYPTEPTGHSRRGEPTVRPQSGYGAGTGGPLKNCHTIK